MGARPSARLLSGLAPSVRPPETALLGPDTIAGTFSVAVAEATRRTTCTARVRRADDLRDFQDRARGDHARGGIPPQRDHQPTGDRDDPNPPQAATAGRKSRPIPLRDRTRGLPVYPLPRQLHADRLQAMIARPTDPLIVGARATLIRQRRKPEH